MSSVVNFCTNSMQGVAVGKQLQRNLTMGVSEFLVFTDMGMCLVRDQGQHRFTQSRLLEVTRTKTTWSPT